MLYKIIIVVAVKVVGGIKLTVFIILAYSNIFRYRPTIKNI